MSYHQENSNYRVSVKALVLNDARDSFLITKDGDFWDIPGGGLDHGESAHTGLTREIEEEMSLKTTSINPQPCYFLTCHADRRPIHIANILYETTLESLDFTPTDECTEIAFLNKDNRDQYNLAGNVQLLLEQFDPGNH